MFVGVAQIETGLSLTVAGDDVHVVDAALVVCHELNARCARVLDAGIYGEVMDFVGEPLGGGRSRPDDSGGMAWIVESGAAVFELNDGLFLVLAPEDGVFGGVGIAHVFRAAPTDLFRDEVPAEGKIDDGTL